MKYNLLYITIIFSVLVFSCATDSSNSLIVFPEDSSPIYYKESIPKKISDNQNNIDKYCRLLKSNKSNQIDNYQILGSWVGENNSKWLNMMITSVDLNNMVSGFIIVDTVFRKFNGWYSTHDNTTFKVGITDEGLGEMNYFDLTISLEEMKITGSSSTVSAKNENLKKPIVLFKRNFEYNVTKGQYPEFSQRKIEDSELKDLSKKELSFICDEILAKHGLIFFDEKSRKYFLNTSWYVPRNFRVDHLLTEIEKLNLDKIYRIF